MGENFGIVCRIEENSGSTIVWSLKTQSLHMFDFIQGFKPGDTINIYTRTKPTTIFNVETDEVGGLARLHKMPIRIRKVDDTIRAYSPLLGEITDVHPNYIFQLETVCSVTAVWTKNDKWSIPEFQSKLAHLTNDQFENFRSSSPCRGVIFRVELGSFVCWSEVHGIVELNLNLSQNIGEEDPDIGSFLWIKVDRIPDRACPIVKHYLVIKPFFKHNLTNEGQFEVIETLRFDGLTETLTGQKVQYLYSTFFDKIYDNYDYPETKISKDFRGLAEVAFCATINAKTLFSFQIVKVLKLVDNRVITSTPTILEKPEGKLGDIQKTIVKHRNLKGVMLSPNSCYCIELKSEYFVPEYMRMQKKDDYFIGKWFEFSSFESNDKLYMLNPFEIPPVLPTRVLAGVPEIQFELTLPTVTKCSTFYSKDLDQELQEVKDVIGPTYLKLWLRHDNINGWQISPLETRQAKDSSSYAEPLPDIDDFNVTHESSISYEPRIPYLTVPNNYKIGFISTEKFIFCPERKTDFYMDEHKIGIPRSKLLGSWVYIYIQVFPNGKEEVTQLQMMSQPLFPTRIVGGIAEVQLECIYDGTRGPDKKPVLYCPEFEARVNDKLEIIKKKGRYRLWIARNNCRDIWFHIAQDERNPTPLEEIPVSLFQESTWNQASHQQIKILKNDLIAMREHFSQLAEPN